MNEKIRNRNRNLRTAFVIASVLNQFVCSIASITNYVGNETFIVIYNIVSIVLTGASSALAWWYNNSFTEEAKKSDELMYALKQNKTLIANTEKEIDVTEFINEECE